MSHIRQQCPREHRVGETCSLKLVMNTIYIEVKCAVCKNIERKAKNFWLKEGRVMRWRAIEPISRKASIKASQSNLQDMSRSVVMLQSQRACCWTVDILLGELVPHIDLTLEIGCIQKNLNN